MMNAAALARAIDELLPTMAASCRRQLGDRVEPVSSAMIDDAEIGDILAIALFRDWTTDINGQSLQDVFLTSAHDALRLSADEAMAHPLLSGWVFQDFADARSKTVMSGAARHDLVQGAPHVDLIAVTTALQGSVSTHASRVDLTFQTRLGPVVVQQRFGAAIGDPIVSEHRAVIGDALFALGVRARQLAPEIAKASEAAQDADQLAA